MALDAKPDRALVKPALPILLLAAGVVIAGCFAPAEFDRPTISLERVIERMGEEHFGPITVDSEGHRRSESVSFDPDGFDASDVRSDCLANRSGVFAQLDGDRLYYVDCSPDEVVSMDGHRFCRQPDI